MGAVQREAIQRCIIVSLILASLSMLLSQPQTWKRPPFQHPSVSVSSEQQETTATRWEELNDLPESFSSCLLIMDDNHRLSEWISYHYFSLPLRYLVVAVDPASKTSPTSVLDRWRERGMTILEWSDENFVDTPGALDRLETDSPEMLHQKHRVRQIKFYKACTQHLQSVGDRTWTTYIDSDEFLTINGGVVENGEELVGQSGSVLEMIKNVRQGSQYQDAVPHFSETPCVTLPRVLYSAKESLPEEVSWNTPASVVDPFRMETLRYRFHTEGSHGLAKSIMDVSQLSENAFVAPGNAHRPSITECPPPHVRLDIMPLSIHHYLGGIESFTYRDDARSEGRNRKEWEKVAGLSDGGASDEIRPWIHGFVNLVGEPEAQLLLADAGVLQPQAQVVEASTEEVAQS